MLKKKLEESLLVNQVSSEKWNVQFDAGRNARGKIGFVLIPNEQTIEKDMLKKVHITFFWRLSRC